MLNIEVVIEAARRSRYSCYADSDFLAGMARERPEGGMRGSDLELR
jgi:hypothetical protein